jgi:inorganic pyrophosphatase
VEFDVTIEIPKGQRNKYEVDHESGRIRLDRMLFTAMAYPATTATSRTPSVRTATRSMRWCCSTSRPSPAASCAPVRSACSTCVTRPVATTRSCASRRATRASTTSREIEDVSEFDRLEIQHFFETYKDLEPGKSVEGAHWAGREEAENCIREAITRAKDAGISTARWRMPEHDDLVWDGGSSQRTPEEISAASERARSELATKENPLSDNA